MDINELEPFAKNYLSAIKEIDKKRDQWQGETRLKIVDRLRSVNSAYKLGWQVEEDNSLRNGETVFLTFYRKASGISRIEAHEDNYTGKHFEKSTTFLAFHLLYNGNINVYIRFPEIEEIFEPFVQIKQLGMLDPMHVENEVIKFVKIFLEELTAWETNNPLQPIGRM